MTIVPFFATPVWWRVLTVACWVLAIAAYFPGSFGVNLFEAHHPPGLALTLFSAVVTVVTAPPVHDCVVVLSMRVSRDQVAELKRAIRHFEERVCVEDGRSGPDLTVRKSISLGGW